MRRETRAWFDGVHAETVARGQEHPEPVLKPDDRKTGHKRMAQFFSGKNTWNALTSLSRSFLRSAVCLEPTKVKMRVRETRHGGITPKLNPAAVRRSFERILESIQAGTPYTIPEKVALPKQEVISALPEAPKTIPLEGRWQKIIKERSCLPSTRTGTNQEGQPSILGLRQLIKKK